MMSKFLPVAFLLVAGALFFGYIHPTVTTSIAEASKKVKEYDSALIAAQRYEQKIAELGDAQKKLPADGITRLQEFLPDSVDNVQLILDLDGLAEVSGIKIDNFNTSDLSGSTAVASSAIDPSEQAASDSGKPYESLDITISASGSYAQMRAFLDGVEGSLRLLDLVALQVTDSPTGIYKYLMTFRLYWLR